MASIDAFLNPVTDSVVRAPLYWGIHELARCLKVRERCVIGQQLLKSLFCIHSPCATRYLTEERLEASGGEMDIDLVHGKCIMNERAPSYEVRNN